jgi:hypothetical protein
MIGMAFRLHIDTKPLEKAVDKGAYKSFSHAAASIAKTGKAKIQRAPRVTSQQQKATKRDARGRFLKGSGKKSRKTRTIPAPVGQAPHTKSGQSRRAIRFEASKTGAVIGFRRSIIGEAMSAHEHGKRYKGTDFPQRPTMGPSLEENLNRFASSWQGSIRA